MQTQSRHWSLIILVFLSFWILGCKEDFDPQSLVDDLEVMAIKAEPSAITVLETTSLTPLIHHEDPVSYRWTVCLFDLGSFAGFECVDAALECCLGEEPTALLSPTDLAANCSKDCLGSDASTVSETSEISAEDLGLLLKFGEIDSLLVRLVITTSEEELEVVKRVSVIQPDETGNTNPVIDVLTYDGDRCEEEEPCPWEDGTVLELYPGETLTLNLAVTPGNSGEDEQIEAMTVAWYATEGEVVNFFTSGEEHETQFKAPKLEDNEQELEVLLWAVARDGEGGTEWTTRKLRTIPNPDKEN